MACHKPVAQYLNTLTISKRNCFLGLIRAAGPVTWTSLMGSARELDRVVQRDTVGTD